MSKFSKGDRVINTETNEQGYIIEVYPPSRGRQLYKVKYDDRETDEISDEDKIEFGFRSTISSVVTVPPTV